ncbi:MAG: hypothetical protein P1V97_26955 [Planctomycetota bacterium]|nr:hypothetical protein [Planctomycetota bacterium]
MDKKSFSKTRQEPSQVHGTLFLIAGSPLLQESCEDAVRTLEQPFLKANMTLKLCQGLPSRSGSSSVLTEVEEHALVEEAYGLVPSVGTRIIVTERGLYNNWFSHWYSAYSTALISVFEWEKIAPQLALSSFIGYELLLHGLRSINRVYEPGSLLHRESKGCLFDFCPDKKSIMLKLQSGVLCRPCRGHLRQLALNDNAIGAVFEEVRTLALSSL